MPNYILNALVSLFLMGSAWAQTQGTITGTVTDEAGRPLTGAKVHITEKGVFVMHRVLQFHETNADGHFRIAHCLGEPISSWAEKRTLAIQIRNWRFTAITPNQLLC